MQLKVNEIIIPEQITFNYEELKTELTKKVKMYEALVYTDDQIKEAKADAASLRKLKTALNDERIRREKEYMKPFNEFKAQINEIIAIIEKPISLIDKQVKEYADKQKKEKTEEIKKLLGKAGLGLYGIKEDLVFNPKWLNASYTPKMIQRDIDDIVEKIDKELATLDDLDEYSFEAKLKYRETLSLGAAVEESNRLKRIEAAKREAERIAQEKAQAAQAVEKSDNVGEVPPDVENLSEGLYTPKEAPEKQWVSFKAYMTVQQAKALAAWCKANEIMIKATEG